jgi:flagellar biosynthesis protein FlhA
MSDITAAPANAVSGIKLPGLGDIGAFFKRGDLALAIGVLTILVVLILPLPPLLLDFSLPISIIFSVLILMTALFIQTPLEFSAFPTVLLIATMLRLALNLASTRLILAHGHEGTDAAGHVIEAFGNFVMSGNFVIGIIVFTILIIVNFVVITKGSGRIAEVAARFHLDAMPGKQMAIDADLSAGLIDEKEARRRRQKLEDEGGFFGAMDGASKFVRGDAIAGLLAGRTSLDPRSRYHPGRHRRWHTRVAQSRDAYGARARTSVAPTMCSVHQPGWISAADCAVCQMGTGLCRVIDRPGR